MDITYAFSVIAGILFIISFIPYIKSILQRKTHPVRVTWLIWGILDTITFAGMYIEKTLNGQTIAALFGAWSIFFLSIRYGVPGWKKIDIVCLAGAMIGIVILIFCNNPILAILTSLSATALGSIPTCASAWEDPSREDKLAWTIFQFSCIAALLSIPRWTWGYAAQPVAFTLINSTMIYILYFHKPNFSRSRV